LETALDRINDCGYMRARSAKSETRLSPGLRNLARPGFSYETTYPLAGFALFAGKDFCNNWRIASGRDGIWP
jgi:hypothetical protein